MHKVSAGPADKSYGIHVAKLAGMPDQLLKRADQILQKLENKENALPTPAAENAASYGVDSSSADRVQESTAPASAEAAPVSAAPTRPAPAPAVDANGQMELFAPAPKKTRSNKIGIASCRERV